VKAVSEVGWARAARFGLMTLAMVPYRVALVPPLRTAWLRMLGARIGSGVVLHDVRFFNLYRRGLSGLAVGDDCFLGDECLLDLAEGIVLGAQVTLAERPSAAHLAAIKDALVAVTKKDVQIDIKVDPAIIGGLVVKLGSRMVDSSLRTKLNAIKHAMKEVS